MRLLRWSKPIGFVWLAMLGGWCLCGCKPAAPPAAPTPSSPPPAPASAPAPDAEMEPFIGWNGETMGSVYSVKVGVTNLPPARVAALQKQIQAALDEVNRQMSHYQPESELSRFNRAPAKAPFKVSPNFAGVVRQALALNQDSGGAFDPTLGPLINLWGFGEQTTQRQVPPAEQLEAAWRLTGGRHLRVTAQDELMKDIAGLQVNLSAIAKGYGVDEMARVLQAEGLTNYFVGISGEIRASGRKANGEPWRVGISAPMSNWRPGDPLVAALPLTDRAISTSGDYQKFFFDAQGRRLCHVLDPRTSHPVQHNLGSVTVIADSCSRADALSTTLFVMGAEEGMKFIERQTNAAALFVVREGEERFKSLPSSRFPKFEPPPTSPN